MPRAKRTFRLLTFPFTLIVWRLCYSWIPKSIQLMFFFALALWGWTTNLDILKKSGIDALGLMEDLQGFQISHSYGLSVVVSMFACLSVWVYGVTESQHIPVFLYLVTFIYWVQPLKYYRVERKTLANVLYKSIFVDQVLLSQVIFCDILTSYSRIICQIMLEAFWFAFPKNKDEYDASRGTLNSWLDIIIPILVALPYLMRLRQCLVEASCSKDGYSVRAHFANAFKYFTSLPLILSGHFVGEWSIAAARNSNIKDHEWYGHKYVFWTWLVVCLLNSAYSLYWDLVMDWQLLRKYSIIPVPEEDHMLLRQNLHFRHTWVYYGAAAYDFLARFLWVLRLWNFGKEDNDSLDYFLALAEILRRWIWVFFRLERQWVNQSAVFHEIEIDEMYQSDSSEATL